MAKKCEQCGAPIEGFWSNLAKLWGVKKSTVNPNMCNKCAPEGSSEPQYPVEPKAESERPMAEPMAEAPGQPEASAPSMPETPAEPSTEATPSAEPTPPAETPMIDKTDEPM